jgi:dihydroflavonol-4-reductase
MLISVTGGAGRLGNVLVRELLARGHAVRMLELHTANLSSVAGLDVELLAGSVLDRDDVVKLIAGADAVFHLAAKVDLDRDRDGSIHRVSVEGSRNVAEASLAAGIRMVHTSSHHALQRKPFDQPLHEDKPLSLDDSCPYHRAKAHAEKLVLDLVDQKGLDAVIVSPGTMIGGFDFEPSIIGRALIDVYHRRVPVLMEVVSDYVHVEDVAVGMILALEKGRAGERYLLTGKVLSLEQVVADWGELTQVRMPRIVLPLWVGWAMLPFSIALARVTGRQPLFTRGVLHASSSNRVVSHEKATRELGFEPRPPVEALGEAVQFYREQGWMNPDRPPHW